MAESKKQGFMKLGITGSRSNIFFDFTALFSGVIEKFNEFTGRQQINFIVTGGARGIDHQAEICAEKSGIPCKVFYPDDAHFGKGAPMKRNRTIVENSDALLVVWNGSPNSRGPIYTACYALQISKPVFVILATGKNIETCIGSISNSAIFTPTEKS